MTSQDDLALLKQMYRRGEISDEQYDVLRRHVLWGTPLPQLMDEVPAPAVPPVPAPRADPDVPTYAAPQAPREGSRQARREAAEAPDQSGYTPSTYRPPTGGYPTVRPSNGYEPPAYPPPGSRPPSPGPANGYGPPPGAADRYGSSPPGPANGYGPPPGGYDAPPAESANGYGGSPAGGYGAEPGSRRARREAAEAEQPAPYLPPAAAYPPASHREAPSESRPSRRRERREAAERSTLPPPSANGFPALSANGFGSGPEPSRWPGETTYPPGETTYPPGETTYPPDELQPRRARREAETPPPDDSPKRRHDSRKPAGDSRKPADQPVKARRRRSLVAVLTSVLLALALAAGGVWWFTLRQAGVLPAEYAKSICGSVRDWQQSVDSSNSTLVTTIAREQDRTAVRTAVSAYYTSIAGRTDQLRVTILDAGVADVAGGQAYADSLAAAVGDEATDLRALSARAGRLDPAAAATFQIELQSLLTGSETAVGNVSSALARPPAGTPVELRSALSAEPSCAPYVG